MLSSCQPAFRWPNVIKAIVSRAGRCKGRGAEEVRSWEQGCVCMGAGVRSPYQISEVEIQTVHSEQDMVQIVFRKEQDSGKWVTAERAQSPARSLIWPQTSERTTEGEKERFQFPVAVWKITPKVSNLKQQILSQCSMFGQLLTHAVALWSLEWWTFKMAHLHDCGWCWLLAGSSVSHLVTLHQALGPEDFLLCFLESISAQVWSIVVGSFTYLPLNIQSLYHHLSKTLSFLDFIGFAPLFKISWLLLGLFLGSPFFCSIDLCAYALAIAYCPDYYNCIVSLKIKVVSPTLFFQNCFTYSRFFAFAYTC